MTTLEVELKTRFNGCFNIRPLVLFQEKNNQYWKYRRILRKNITSVGCKIKNNHYTMYKWSYVNKLRDLV